MGRLDGKVAIVTGAARGTGAEIARLFAEEGARVVLGDVRDELGRQVAKELGDAALFAHLDVTDPASWQAALAETRAAFGAPSVLVNNAAVLLMRSIADTSVDDFTSVVGVNLLGPFLGIQACAPAIAEAGGGSIVNISSTDGVRAQNALAAYASSKWGLRGLTRVAAAELGSQGIRVNAVCPEAGNADMSRPFLPPEMVAKVDLSRVVEKMFGSYLRPPKGRERHADRVRDVAYMALFLASDESASCTGADFLVDAGMTSFVKRGDMPGA
ncbi:MAG: SDR family oxidoreductase [Myxococcota bacterium]|nr:SDR family oxidoreductase [Myxococcales bacterium]